MKMQDESKSLTSSKQQHINSILFVACFAAAVMAIFASVSLNPGFVNGQESGGTEVGAIQNATNMSSSTSNSSLVGFDSNIEQIRGHLDQAVSNKEIGNTTLAKAHTLHPIEEIYSSIEVQIDATESKSESIVIILFGSAFKYCRQFYCTRIYDQGSGYQWITQ